MTRNLLSLQKMPDGHLTALSTEHLASQALSWQASLVAPSTPCGTVLTCLACHSWRPAHMAAMTRCQAGQR